MAAANVQRQEGVLGEWGHDTADRRPLDLLVAQARGAKATRNDGPSIPGDFKVGNNIIRGEVRGEKVRRFSVTHRKELTSK